MQKLMLNKETITSLNSDHMKEVNGGDSGPCITFKATICNPLSCVSCNPCQETQALSVCLLC